MINNPAVRAGLTHGLVGGVMCLLISAAIIVHLSRAPLGLLSPLVGIAFLAGLIYFFLAYIFAGHLAASRTGRVGDGALAGIITGVVISISTCVAITGEHLLTASATTPASSLIAPASGGILSMVTRMLIDILASSALLGVFAGLGALGGLAGRQAYRRRLPGHDTPARRRAPTERTVLFGLAAFLVVGMCMLFTMSGM
jgi:hypothetical protein